MMKATLNAENCAFLHFFNPLRVATVNQSEFLLFLKQSKTTVQYFVHHSNWSGAHLTGDNAEFWTLSTLAPLWPVIEFYEHKKTIS